jgi:NAD(P)-dependent dehydrogenase (short-subunit alcohol dehydrogenase family)/acyl carrier protein
LPPRAQWAAHLVDQGEADVTSRKIRAVEALEKLGADVVVASADVSDETQMREVVNEAYRRFGRIDGVIDEAGVAGGGVMQLKTPEAAAGVLVPKVGGAEVLKRVLQGTDVDFLVLCSSLTSIVGGVGQVDYCGANAYLDAFARWNTTRGGAFTIAINWDGWREVGMASAQIPAQVVVSTRTPAVELLGAGRKVAGATDQQVRRTASGETSVKVQAHPRPNLPTPFIAPTDGPERVICDIWRESLGLESVGIHDSFFDLGGDSLLAIGVVAQINHTFGTGLPVATLYEAFTVRFLVEAVEGDLAQRGEVVDDVSVPDERQQKMKRQKERRQKSRLAKRQVRGLQS